MFDLIGIDWGEVRFGLAFGNTKTGLVIPANTDNNTIDIFSILSREIEIRKPKNVVVGLPTSFKLQPTEVTQKIEYFISSLKNLYPTLSISTVNERNTTKDTKTMLLPQQKQQKLSPNLKNKMDKHAINNQSAANILEYYLAKILSQT